MRRYVLRVPARLRLRGRRAKLAGDRAPLSRRCRLPGDLRNQVPDHATIARFRVRHEASLADLFGQVLGLCADAGLVEVGVLAVDGTKLAASASNHATRSYEQIAQEILAEAAGIDAAEDEVHGEARGDELPEHLARREGRRAWLRETKERLEPIVAAVDTDPQRTLRVMRVINNSASLRARNLEKHNLWTDALTPIMAQRLNSSTKSASPSPPRSRRGRSSRPGCPAWTSHSLAGPQPTAPTASGKFSTSSSQASPASPTSRPSPR